MKKYLPHVAAFLLLVLLSFGVVHAQDGGVNTPTGPNGGVNTPSGSGATIPNPLKGANTLEQFLLTLVNNIVLPIGSIVAVLAFIWSGFMYVTARGDEGRIKKASASLLYTAIGTAVLLGAVTIANVISGTIKQL